jgi:hypothetical protein
MVKVDGPRRSGGHGHCSCDRGFLHPQRISVQLVAENVAWHLRGDRRLGAKIRPKLPIDNGVLDFCCFEHRPRYSIVAHSQCDHAGVPGRVRVRSDERYPASVEKAGK